jgi:Fibronectin type III domain
MPLRRRALFPKGRKPPWGTPIDKSDPITDRMVAAFMFGEGGGLRAYNAVGIPVSNPVGNPGQVFGLLNTATSAWTNGRGGPAWSGDGSSRYIDIGESAVSVFPAALNLTGPMTIMAEVYPTSFSGTASTICGDANSNTTLVQFFFYLVQTSGKIGMDWGASGSQSLVGTTGLSLNKWAPIGGVRAGSSGAWTAQTWLNGSLDNSSSLTGNPSVQSGAAIGKIGAGTGGTSYNFAGRIGYVYIFARAALAGEFSRVAGDPYSFFGQPRRVFSPSSLLAPGAPSGLAAAYGSTTSVTLTFTQGSGTVANNGYRYSTDNATWTTGTVAAGTSITVTGLTSGQLYYFQVNAQNAAGSSAYTSSVIWVCGSNFTGQVGLSSDDAFQNTLGTVTIADSTDTLVALDYLGFRFQNIIVPANADISGAYLLIYLSSVTGISGSITLDFENVANSTTFAATSNNISGRTPTGQSATWNIGSLGTGWNTSPNLASAFDTVNALGGWASGNASNVIVKGLVGAAGFTTQMWDGNPIRAAVLAIYFSTASSDESGTLGDTMGMMAASNVLVLESQQTTFIPY